MPKLLVLNQVSSTPKFNLAELSKQASRFPSLTRPNTAPLPPQQDGDRRNNAVQRLARAKPFHQLSQRHPSSQAQQTTPDKAVVD